MKTEQTKPIPRDPDLIPKPLSNPASALIRDTLEHYGITQTHGATAMKVSKSLLSDVIRQKKGVSASLALRFQFCFGVPAELLVRLQSDHDFQTAYHTKTSQIAAEVTRLVPA